MIKKVYIFLFFLNLFTLNFTINAQEINPNQEIISSDELFKEIKNEDYLPPMDILLLFKDAVFLYYNGQIEESIKIHKSIIEKEPFYSESYLELAALQKEMGDMKGALETYNKLCNVVDSDNKNYKERYFITAVQSFDHKIAFELLPMEETNYKVLFYLGVLYYDSKRYDEALTYFDKALASNEYLAEAAYYKGLIYTAKKNYNEAVASFSLCLKIEPNFTMALYDLAIAQEKIKNNQKALANLYKAKSNLGESSKIKDALRRLESKQPRVDRNVVQKKQIARKDAQTPPRATIFSNTVDSEKVMVRIGIVEKARQLSLKTSGDYLLSDGINEYRGKAGDLFFVRQTKEGLFVYDRDNNIVFNSEKDINFSYADPSFTTTVFDIMNGAGFFFAGVVDRTYRGNFSFLNRSAGITLVNTLEMEEYLYSVVPSEVPASWPMEALKAQAVAARSFTISTMGTYKSRGFDLYGSVVSHAYTGITSEHNRTTEAVNATRNLVMYEDRDPSKVMITYYSANHGAYSEKGDVVWNGKRGGEHEAVADKNEKSRTDPLPLYKLIEWVESRPLTHSNWNKYHFSPAFRSSMMVSNYEMSLRVARSRNIGEIKAIIPRLRGISGRVAVADAVSEKNKTTIEGDTIRSRLGGLRSNLVVMEYKLNRSGQIEYFMIKTAGWGHGVGMDQSGAAGMAADDFNYKDILAFYYPKGTLNTYPNKE